MNATVAVVTDGPRQQARHFSFDNGATWSELRIRMPGMWADAYAICPLEQVDGKTLFGYADATGFHIDRTMSLQLPETDARPVDTTGIGDTNPGEHPIHALGVVTGDSAPFILAGTFGDGLYKWHGKEWTFAGLPGSQIWRIVVKDYDVPVEAGHGH